MGKIVQTAGRDALSEFAPDAKAAHAAEMVFPIGAPNDAFAQYFIGQSYLAPVSTSQVRTVPVSGWRLWMTNSMEN